MRVPLLGTMLMVPLLAGAASPDAAPLLPNVVIILADDMGYGDLGCNGVKRFPMPNFDRLAREGRRFSNFHVAHPLCSASRAALLTGCYSNRFGLNGALYPHSPIGLPEQETTIAQLLKKRGYATGMVGKWHLGDHPSFLPTRRGFDEYFGLPYSNDMWPHGGGRRNSHLPALPLIEGDRVVKPDIQPADQHQLTTWYTEHAVSFIERNKERPFFLYFAHSMPHVPLSVSDKFRGKSGHGMYADVLMEIDWSVGEVLSALEKNGVDQNTLVIFTSDNGPWLIYGDHAGSARPFREGKGTCWEGGVRVPCLMRWPGKISAGTHCHSMLMTIDLLPTIAKLAGAELPQQKIDGLDVWPILAGRRFARNPHPAYYFYNGNSELHAMVSGDGHWKLVFPHTYGTMNGGPGGRGGVGTNYAQFPVTLTELYNLRRDIGETTNVVDKQPQVVKRLLELAESARADLGDARRGREGSGMRPVGRLSEGERPGIPVP
jgi:arylsulfatase A